MSPVTDAPFLGYLYFVSEDVHGHSSVPKDSIAVPFRLSAGTAQIIFRGLDFIYEAWFKAQQKYFIDTAYPFMLRPLAPGVSGGTFSQPIMDRILALRSRLAPKTAKGGRIQMDWLELRISIFACRVALGRARYVSISHKGKPIRKPRNRRPKNDPEIAAVAKKAKRAIASLERHQKKATRYFRKTVDDPEFAARDKEWKQHLRWVRLHLAFFRLREVLNPAIGTVKFHRLLIRRLVEIGTESLQMQGYEAPLERSIWGAIRLYLHDCRRFRIQGPYYVDIIHSGGTYWERRFLAEYIVKRLHLKQVRRPVIPRNLPKQPAAQSKPSTPRAVAASSETLATPSPAKATELPPPPVKTQKTDLKHRTAELLNQAESQEIKRRGEERYRKASEEAETRRRAEAERSQTQGMREEAARANATDSRNLKPHQQRFQHWLTTLPDK